MQRKAEFTGLTMLSRQASAGIQNRLMSELREERAEFCPTPLQRMLVRNLSMRPRRLAEPIDAFVGGQSANLSTCTKFRFLIHWLGKFPNRWPVTEWSAQPRERSNGFNGDWK